MFLPLLLPFYGVVVYELCVVLFGVLLFSLDPVWFDHRFSHLFHFLLLNIFLLSHKDMFLYCFRLYCLSHFLKKPVSCLLVLSKVRRFTFFQNKKLCRKNFMCSCLSVSFQFFFHLFFVSFFV